MKHYAYYRVSTSTQAEANGTQMQEDVVKAYCKQNNITIDDSFTDLGISGTVVDREGITELLANLEKGDKIIVQNTSRLWRSDIAKVMIRHEIEKAGSDVISIEQPMYSVYTKDPNDFLINGMMELLDQYERMSISMKLAKGRKARAKKGSKPCGSAPIGYKWEDNNIVIDWNNNLIVEDIFKAYVELKSLAKLQAYCTDKGYKTTQGKEFSKQALKNIINNDFYIGIVTYADKKVNGEHQPIISKELYDMANQILTK